MWSIIKIAQQNEPQKTETPLFNGRKTTVINFHTISYIGNLLNYANLLNYIKFNYLKVELKNQTYTLKIICLK